MKFLTSIALAGLVLLAADSAQASQPTQMIQMAWQQAQLPQGQLSDYRQEASLPSRYNTGGERIVVFSPRYKEWAAYDADGYKVASGVANGGKPGHRTPAGSYRIYNKAGPGHVSSKYPKPTGGAPMPYAMHFTKAGHAIHGSPEISNVNGSHGCVRVKTTAAKWLSSYFVKPGTKLVVHSY